MSYDDFFAASSLLCSILVSESSRPLPEELQGARKPISVRPSARRLRAVGERS